MKILLDNPRCSADVSAVCHTLGHARDRDRGRGRSASGAEIGFHKDANAKSGEVLIRVAAAGVNYPDIIQREGPFPLPPGTPETLGPGDFGGPSQASVPTSVLDSIH